ncbi:hypothetical protein RHGRI_024995 [Rhododendron griersonianum]|uniref:Uncharacterized protein n=1 Tax=Rhododendron griersonianum TaxID=479676 RepID=A0AAV6JEA0_9ERIC|nr:hypothetical protein RHGRI_024995 [Rhododendron griersonianum]
MGGNQVTEEVDTPNPGKPVGSMALTLYEDKNLSVGEPWSTGLFDCHENQTNGWNGVLAQQQGGKYQDQEFPSPPSKQMMYK